MDDPAATLDQNGSAKELSATKAGDAVPYRSTSLRFTYPSGSKPLNGYTIKRGIGIGGFGEVYFALSDAGKEVALKRIQRNVDVELRGVSQCLNLKHSNLITLWDIRQDDHGEGWVVMEYVPGPSLRDVIEESPEGLPEDECHRWFTSIAHGVAYLHDHGIVHRDLKPGNIFLDEEEQIIKIGDYGLSKFISCSRRSGQTESVGTFHYMAPEIGKGVYGKEIDIYALGIILYEMLTGRVPFEGESSQEIIMKHLTAEPQVDDVPEPYRSVVRRSMSKDPDRRFSSAAEMLETLHAARNSVSTYGSRPLSGNVAGPADMRNREPILNADLVGSEQHSPLPPRRDVEPSAGVPPKAQKELFYIGEEEGIILGEVQRVVTAHSQPGKLAGNQLLRPGETVSHLEEPIARTVHGGWLRLVQTWNQSNLSTPIKVFVLVMVGITLIVNSGWLLPLCSGLAIVYGAYFGIRSLIQWRRRNAKPPVQSQRRRSATAGEWNSLREAMLRGQLARQPHAESVMNLIGSMLMSAIVIATVGAISMAVTVDSLQPAIDSLAFFSWISATGVVSCWSLLVLGRVWQTTRGDGWHRRLIMAAMGVFVGWVSYFVADMLMVDVTTAIPALGTVAWAEPELGPTWQIPVLPAFIIYFSGLFFVMRWWRQADPLRRTRLSIVAIGFSLLWACAFNAFCQFPLPWGILMAGMISFAVQISAPHLDRVEREQLETDARRHQVQSV